VWRNAQGRVRAHCWSHECPEIEILAALGEIKAPIATSNDGERMRTVALRIWRQTQTGAHTLVEKYLRLRGIRLEVPSDLRFHPWLKHPSGVFAPAMVAGVRNGGGTQVAIHRTYLAPDGSSKANIEPQKAALGAIAGGAVALAPVGETIGVAEGIETALSVQQATGIPSLAALSASGLANVQLPASVREVIIAADADETGESAAFRAAQKFIREGRSVRIARPSRPGADFNDRLKEA
jgi:hypothetical protein